SGEEPFNTGRIRRPHSRYSNRQERHDRCDPARNGSRLGSRPNRKGQAHRKTEGEGIRQGAGGKSATVLHHGREEGDQGNTRRQGASRPSYDFGNAGTLQEVETP